MTTTLEQVAEDAALLEIGRKAIEDELIELRDSRIILDIRRNNGFVVKEKDGTPSPIIRFGPEVGLQIALVGALRSGDIAERVAALALFDAEPPSHG